LNTLTQTLASISRSLPGLLPELALAGLFVLLILVDLIRHGKSGKPLAGLTLAGLALTGYLVYRQGVALPAPAGGLFFGLLRPDRLAVYLKGIIGLSGLLTLLLALVHPGERRRTERVEWLAPFVALVLGAYLLVMSTNLLMVYLSLELVSLSSYVLTAYNGDRPAAEGGMKYLLFGAMSSAVMLYGISWMYGFTGSLDFTDPAFYGRLGGVPPLPLLVAVFLTLGGLLFKVAAVPFHVWAPDAYQAAPLPVAAFFSVAPKAAAFGVLLRVVGSLHPKGFGNLSGLEGLPIGLCLVILLTLTVGNFAALWQGNARRMLAYSSVAHAGFLLIGVVAGNAAGTESLLFYLGVYVFMNLAAFLLVAVLAERAGSEQMDRFGGLGTQLPLAGVVAVLVMVALAGLPPTAGFTAKLLLFSALWQAYGESGNGWLLAVFGVGLLNVAVSLFYYLKIPFYLFFRPLTELNATRLGMYEGALLLLMALPLVGLFFAPHWLYQVITSITK